MMDKTVDPLSRVKASCLIMVIGILAVFATTETLKSNSRFGNEHVLGGRPDAPISIEVFSDFQCPVCKTFYVNTIRPLLTFYCQMNCVCVVYREFPLPSHTYAIEAARYSLAAQRLGQAQWTAVVDALFRRQENWSRDGKVDDAIMGSLSPLDFDKIKRIVREQSTQDALISEIRFGQQRRIKSTPTWFAVSASSNEQRIEGLLDYRAVKSWLDSILDRMK